MSSCGRTQILQAASAPEGRPQEEGAAWRALCQDLQSNIGHESLIVWRAGVLGIVKAATMWLGMKGLLDDLGVKVKVQVNTDSSAAKSMASRRGAGRVRHIDVRELWVQDRVAEGELSVVKVKGEENVTDGLTKRVNRQKMGKYMVSHSMVWRIGRRELCPRLGDGQ